MLEAVDTYSVANAEAITYVGEELRALEAEVRRLGRGPAGAEADGRAAELGELDPPLAELLSREGSHLGYAAQAGLWFDPPVWLSYETGRVEIGGVNERIAELPFAFRALARLEPGAKVLDVGAAESAFRPLAGDAGLRRHCARPAADPAPPPAARGGRGLARGMGRGAGAL